jgi:hypothetical protein
MKERELFAELESLAKYHHDEADRLSDEIDKIGTDLTNYQELLDECREHQLLANACKLSINNWEEFCKIEW